VPTLPNLGDIPQAQFDRIVAAFPGTTAAEKTASYQAWLTNSLIGYVEQVEGAVVQTEVHALMESRMRALRDSLPPRLPFTPPNSAGRTGLVVGHAASGPPTMNKTKEASDGTV
jgi:hypothetical protein